MANPNVEAAYFLVQVGQNETNQKFRVKGSDFKNVAKGPEMVWVQRGADHYWTWYGQVEDTAVPDLSYRFNYSIQGFNEGLPGGEREQPDQDGQINFSLYFEAPGPYPVNEWRNIRNLKSDDLKDLDGKTLVLKNNTEIKDGDICRITHTGGDFEAWYVFDTPDGNSFIKFKTLYTKGGDGNDANRERTDVKREGSRPEPDGAQELVLAIYKKASLKPFNTIRDTDWVLAQGKDENNDWQHFKVSGKNFKSLFTVGEPPQIDYFRHTLNSPYTLCSSQTTSWKVQWNVLGDTTCKVLRPDGTVLSTAKTGEQTINTNTLGEWTYTLEATGSDGTVETRTITPITVCDLPRNSLSGPSNGTYGNSYTLSYTQSGHTTGDLAGATVTSSSGSKSYTKYPSKETTYCSVLKSTNCCGTTSKTHCVKIPGYSIAPVSINGLAVKPKKKDEFYVSPLYNNNSNKLKNVEYKWELDAGIESGFANFNGVSAGKQGVFVSTDESPLVFCNNNTHNNSGNAVSGPPGKLPNGVKLTLTVTNKDNGEKVSTYGYFEIYPQF